MNEARIPLTSKTVSVHPIGRWRVMLAVWTTLARDAGPHTIRNSAAILEEQARTVAASLPGEVVVVSTSVSDASADYFVRNLVVLLVELEVLDLGTPNPFPKVGVYPWGNYPHAMTAIVEAVLWLVVTFALWALAWWLAAGLIQ